jgi:MFS transporter, FHS family, glucose/mannose:H+ symporter
MAATQSKGRLIVAMILAIFVYGSIAALLGTILPQLKDRLSLDNAQAGYVAMAYAIGLAIASIAIGPILDNVGKKAGIVAGLTGIAVSLAGLAVVNSYGTALGAMLLLGLGGGMLVTGSNTLISDVAEERRASALNLLNIFFGLGGMVTPFMAANIPALNGSYALCLTLAAVTGVTMVVNLVTPMPPPSGGGGFVFAKAGALLNQPALYLLSLYLFLYVACEVGVWNWLVEYLHSTRGVAENYAQNVLSFGFAFGLLVGRLIASRVLLGVPEIRVTLFASAAMALTTFAMLKVSSPPMVGAVVFLAGLAMAPMFPTVLGMVGNVFRQMTATAMGIVITSGWIGLVISSPIIGWISNQSDLGTGLLLLPAMSVIMVVTNLALRPYVSKPAGATAGARA